MWEGDENEERHPDHVTRLKEKDENEVADGAPPDRLEDADPGGSEQRPNFRYHEREEKTPNPGNLQQRQKVYSLNNVLIVLELGFCVMFCDFDIMVCSLAKRKFK